MKYYRATIQDNPKSDEVGWIMFAKDLDRIDCYGDNYWVINTDDCKGHTIDAQAIIDIIVRIVREELTPPENPEYYNPVDIVNSAEAYDDPDMTIWLWGNVLDARWDWVLIQTNNGAVLFASDEIVDKVVKKLDRKDN